ncbi:hypothetical protein CC1G_15687 [Coprinopsis cinerea okayama7|uniref:Uncharacterized protein n=1 Tax=Coprinopsis cinerea (strain Okayama-7 / 130 / ATCC MYA-4618 / FGSC 9003) TaxID=240176 RepID=D6RQE8_COPC7|nr:hypothetical protein CC1G_15687 [Coprinopsis cinerea okayama7\|eukprot:XP_002910258.1 hypothetical protein CC1G_15687 [Coprinopsis cinerea okayama7\
MNLLRPNDATTLLPLKICDDTSARAFEQDLGSIASRNVVNRRMTMTPWIRV